MMVASVQPRCSFPEPSQATKGVVLAVTMMEPTELPTARSPPICIRSCESRVIIGSSELYGTLTRENSSPRVR